MKSKTVKESDIKYRVETDDNGNISWFKHKSVILHRDAGPAVTYINGYKSWYKNGKLHNSFGPAIDCGSEYKAWFIEGKLHREDGPAREFYDGRKQYWLNDVYLKDIKSDEELIIKLLLE